MDETILVALGGNALIRDNQKGSFDEQLQNAHDVARRLVDVIGDETRLVLAHGNGPQVGNLLLQNDTSEERVRELPLFGCNAASQGLIGSILSLGFNNLFSRENLSRRAVPMLTPVVVESEEIANPTKPIGSFYSIEEAEEQEKDGVAFKEDAGRGWRRIVPSPPPESVSLTDQIFQILDNGNVPIVTGGGGLPVIENEAGEHEYVDAVVDKDLAAGHLADQINADRFVILTDVEHVLLNYGTENESVLQQLDPESADKYLSEGHFKRGSMYEKVQAASAFVESNPDRHATITSLDLCAEGLRGNRGTQFETKN